MVIKSEALEWGEGNPRKSPNLLLINFLNKKYFLKKRKKEEKKSGSGNLAYNVTGCIIVVHRYRNVGYLVLLAIGVYGLSHRCLLLAMHR